MVEVSSEFVPNHNYQIVILIESEQPAAVYFILQPLDLLTTPKLNIKTIIKNNKSNEKSQAPALEKGLLILECLSNQAEPLTLSQLAVALGRNVSEIQRMVNVLHNADYLIRSAQGGYSLSSKLYRMALRYPPYRDLEILLRPAMYAFVDTTQESVHLSLLQETKMVVVAQVESPKLARISLQIGQRQDPIDTVSGRVLLAGLPEEELAIVLKKSAINAKKLTWLKQRLKEIQDRGYESMESSVYSGVYDLGIPVKNAEGNVLAALTTTWLATKDVQASKRQATVEKALLNALQSALEHCQI